MQRPVSAGLQAGASSHLSECARSASSSSESLAAENLVALARRTEIPALARTLLRKRRISSKILAVQTLGHLREADARDEIRSLVEHDNTALSLSFRAEMSRNVCIWILI